MTEIQKRLFEMQDEKYREFQAKLMPTVAPDTVIGVRTPPLRAFAKELFKSGDTSEFMASLPHEYYEENNLHGFLIEKIKDFDEAIAALDTFLPFVDNWATCDTMAPKVLKKHPEKLLSKIDEWIASGKCYTVRFAVEALMNYYLDDNFSPDQLTKVVRIVSDEYYVNMMRAWYFATALAKQYDCVLPLLENRDLDVWTHNKTIQKAIESYRITDEQKEYLRSLKIKKK